MFSLRSNGLARASPLHPGGSRCAPLPPVAHAIAGGSFVADVKTAGASRRSQGGRPKGDPAALRVCTIGVRVSPAEYAALRAKADAMGMAPAQWLREAALSRRLPSPPVPAINRAQYAELARLSANLNQLAHAVNIGQPVAVADALLQRLAAEVTRLRLALLAVP